MIRRIFDLVVAGIGFIVMLPLFAAISLAIKLDDGGLVLYRQPRVGKGFRIFRMLKFRTMVANADHGSLLTAPNDSRVTRVGRYLRKWKLDEMPQLVNVIKGEMHLVGSRPEVEKYVGLFHEQYAVLLRDAPGITDPASLAYRDEDKMFAGNFLEDQYLRQILPRKLTLSLDYQQHRNFLSDLRVIFQSTVGSAPCSNPKERESVDPELKVPELKAKES